VGPPGGSSLDTNKPALPNPATDKAIVTAAAGDAPAPAPWLARYGTSLFFVALVVGGAAYYFLRRSTNPSADAIILLKVFIGLGIVIFIHELGHFLAAKWCNVHVLTFSIGFGPPLFGICKFQGGETLYKIGWIPLGGFVRMLGEGTESEDGDDDPRSYK